VTWNVGRKGRNGPAERVDRDAQPAVGYANQGQPLLDGAKRRGSHELEIGRLALDPAVIREVDDRDARAVSPIRDDSWEEDLEAESR
jgi:hypothetical protein